MLESSRSLFLDHFSSYKNIINSQVKQTAKLNLSFHNGEEDNPVFRWQKISQKYPLKVQGTLNFSEINSMKPHKSLFMVQRLDDARIYREQYLDYYSELPQKNE